jgi:capsular polysaccharide transport system permease protein
MYRAGMFGNALPTFWDPWYILLWGIGANALGWVVVLKAQKHIEME